MKKKEGDRRQRTEEKEEIGKHVKATAINFTGLPDEQVHVHVVDDKTGTGYIEKLQEIERKTGNPISVSDPDFPMKDTYFIHKPGLHLGYDAQLKENVFEVRITPFEEMSEEQRMQCEKAIIIMQDYTTVVPAINNNGSQNLKTKDKAEGRKFGKMFAAGWHGTRGERNATLGYYAFDRRNEEHQKLYLSCCEGMTVVKEAFEDGLSSMFPVAYNEMRQFAENNHIPDFAMTEMPKEGSKFGALASSLTITRNDFSNFQHCDHDACVVAYGWWWVSYQEKKGAPWKFDPSKHDHGDVKGGQFLIGKYGYAINFERIHGLVEIIWRGQKDWHGTLASTSIPNVTRFGTSIQITQSALNGVERWRREGQKLSNVKGVSARLKYSSSSVS